MQEYSLADLRKLFQLPPALIRKLGQAGCIAHPGSRGKGIYTFQDLSILRVASALKAANIPSSKIVAALTQIQTVLPADRGLSTVAVAASGKGIAVHDGSGEREASGQYALPLRVNQKTGRIAHLQRSPRSTTGSVADDHHRRGRMLEDTDPVAARAAYLATLRIQEDHLEASIDLGRLLHEDGQLKEAENVYRLAMSKSSSAILSYNLAIVLEDLDRAEEAIAMYHEALARDPLLHDAHFNLSRLYEIGRRPRDALRHLLAYQRHISRYGE
jgi:tetratricopeptide (TPR) repeat protein